MIVIKGLNEEQEKVFFKYLANCLESDSEVWTQEHGKFDVIVDKVDYNNREIELKARSHE